MKYQSLHIATSYRRFRALAARLRKSLNNGQFQQMAAAERSELIKKLRRLYGQLYRVVGGRRLQKVLAAGALVLGLGLNTTQAQTFGDPQLAPFGLSGNNGSLIIPIAADMDGDGDVDLLCTAYESFMGGKVFYFENEGTATTPNYTTRVESPFGMVAPGSVTALTVGDIDDDGDLDVLLGTYEENGAGQDALLYFENTGTATAPAFGEGIAEPFGIENLGGDMVPKLVDIDGDGDLDLFNTNYNGNTYESSFFYQENTGTANAPAFSAAVEDPIGLPVDLPVIPLYDFADMDNDGDLDMLFGNYEYLNIGNTYRAFLSYVENTGTANAPAFGTPVDEPFGIEFPNESFFPLPTIADFDDDGDLDVMTFAYVYSSLPNDEVNLFVYFENESPIVNTDELNEQTAWNVFPTITRGQLNWQLPNANGEEMNLEIYNSTGQLVGAHSVRGEQGTLSVAYLANGNYFLRLSSQDGETYQTKQITKQ